MSERWTISAFGAHIPFDQAYRDPLIVSLTVVAIVAYLTRDKGSTENSKSTPTARVLPLFFFGIATYIILLALNQ